MGDRNLRGGFLRVMGLGELSEQGGKTVLGFWMILLLSFFLFADQNLISPNLQNIGNSFGITERSDIDWYLGGIIPILFFILGGLVSLSMGYLSQKMGRKRLLMLTVLLGETACLLSGFSSSYWEFVLYRTLCGFGIGGIFPLLFSMLGDFFSSKARSNASAYASLSMALGIGVGQYIGGMLGQMDPVNGWRLSFIYMALPSYFFVLIYWIFCKEPTRGGSEAEWKGVAKDIPMSTHELHFKDLRLLATNKTNLGIFLQGIPGCVPWGIFFVFLVDYYERDYGLMKADATLMVTIAGIGIFAGTFFGGFLGQYLHNKRRVYLPILCMVAVFLGIPPTLYLLYADSIVGSPMFIVMNFVAGFLMSITGSNVRAILLNANLPKNRAAMFSIYNLTDDLGKGLGPAMSALLLTAIPDRAISLSVAILFWIPCGLFWIPVIRNYEREEAQVHELLKEEVEEAHIQKIA